MSSETQNEDERCGDRREEIESQISTEVTNANLRGLLKSVMLPEEGSQGELSKPPPFLG